MDRVDLRVQVKPLSRSELAGQHGQPETTATVAERVLAARERAAARYADTPWSANSDVPGHELRTRWPAEPGALSRAEDDMEQGLLTARGMDRVLRVAWTVADLAGHDRPTTDDVDWALELRTGIKRSPTAFRAPLAAPRSTP
jgi:magnesium chelatase family protein